MIVRLGDLQAAYRGQQRSKRRHGVRQYLLDGAEPSPTAYQIVSRRLYATGRIDNLGLADLWVATASPAERARLFSDIATALLTR